MTAALATATDELARRTAMLDAVGFAARSIVASPDWRQGVEELLRRLGEATGVSRVTLWEVHPGPEGLLRQSCRYDWAAAGFQPISDDARYSDIQIQDGEVFIAADRALRAIGSAPAVKRRPRKVGGTSRERLHA